MCFSIIVPLTHLNLCSGLLYDLLYVSAHFCYIHEHIV
uniref:Uncharacterized protein n=1 Tax=Arundo donax TaxID=35708 RepID=A0A0A9EYD1_ARUDO